MTWRRQGCLVLVAPRARDPESPMPFPRIAAICPPLDAGDLLHIPSRRPRADLPGASARTVMPGLLVLVATGCAPTGSADPELEICDRVATVVTALYEPTTPTREQQTWADADVVQLIDGGPLHVPSESWPNNSVFLLQLGVDGVSEWSTVYVEIDVWSDLYEVPFASGAWAYDRKSDCSLQRDGEIETIRVHSGLSACDDLWRVDGTPVHVEVSLHDSGPLGEGVSQEFELVAAAVPSERCPGESG